MKCAVRMDSLLVYSRVMPPCLLMATTIFSLYYNLARFIYIPNFRNFVVNHRLIIFHVVVDYFIGLMPSTSKSIAYVSSYITHYHRI